MGRRADQRAGEVGGAIAWQGDGTSAAVVGESRYLGHAELPRPGPLPVDLLAILGGGVHSVERGGGGGDHAMS